MIKINDRFYITADSNAYMLKEKSTVQDETSENFGKETFTILGYFTTIESCVKAILKKYGREFAAKEEINSLQDLKQEIIRQHKLIQENLKDLKE